MFQPLSESQDGLESSGPPHAVSAAILWIWMLDGHICSGYELEMGLLTSRLLSC